MESAEILKMDVFTKEVHTALTCTEELHYVSANYYEDININVVKIDKLQI